MHFNLDFFLSFLNLFLTLFSSKVLSTNSSLVLKWFLNNIHKLVISASIHTTVGFPAPFKFLTINSGSSQGRYLHSSYGMTMWQLFSQVLCPFSANGKHCNHTDTVLMGLRLSALVSQNESSATWIKRTVSYPSWNCYHQGCCMFCTLFSFFFFVINSPPTQNSSGLVLEAWNRGQTDWQTPCTSIIPFLTLVFHG